MRFTLVTMAALFVATIVLQAQTQLQLRQEACDQAKMLEAELASTYASALAVAERHGAASRHNLELAQEAWAAFRDAELRSRYPAEDPGEYGTIHPMCICLVRSELTQQRIDQLNRFVSPVEGDVCGVQ